MEWLNIQNCMAMMEKSRRKKKTMREVRDAIGIGYFDVNTSPE
ncbi:hypothetical protein [Paenibacillus sp. NPDC055715]